MTPRYPLKNSANVVWVDTSVHRCTVMEDTTSYSEATLTQGRDATNPIPRFSMLAGKPPTRAEVQRHNDRASGLRRMLATAIGAWTAFGLLLWIYYSTRG